jgi:hypothetical protein
VRELVLVLPDLFLRGAAPTSSAGASLTSLRFAAPRLMRGGWRGTVARGVGRDDLTLIDEASVIDAALRLDELHDDDGDHGDHGDHEDIIVDAWIATPVHLMAGLKTVHFPANGVLRLSEDEASELSATFATTFGAEGLELRPAGAAGFVLRGLEAVGALTVEPARLIGESLETHLPSGAGSAELRALASEIEMWLHGLPLNRRREVRGEPGISSLWMWGGGQPPRDRLRPTRAASRWSRIVTDDVWAHALGRLSSVPVSSLPKSIDEILGDISVASDDESLLVITPVSGVEAEYFDQAWVAPAARALREGRLGRFTVAANDRWTSVDSGDRYRVWRPKRMVFTAVADGGA